MRINEIFYSLQGEGHYAGTPAVFVRFAGCNLRCGFCDTSHEEAMEMTDQQIIEAIGAYPARRVILTGGEPTLQLTARFIGLLHDRGYKVHVESNGTRRLPAAVDWLVVSPKEGSRVVAEDIDELKVIYHGQDDDPERWDALTARERYIQPCDLKDADTNRRIIAQAVRYVKGHPHWRLSLQTHKFIDIP